MTFIELNGKSVELTRPIMLFLYLSFAIAFGLVIFTMLMYGMLQVFTSSGFSELNSTDDGRERIDDDDDLEDV